MQHGDLGKTKVLKTEIVSMSDVRKPNSKSVLKSVTPVRPVLNTDQIGWTYPRACPAPSQILETLAGLVRPPGHTYPAPSRVSKRVAGHIQPLTQTCPGF
jgi:hypothetical protein